MRFLGKNKVHFAVFSKLETELIQPERSVDIQERSVDIQETEGRTELSRQVELAKILVGGDSASEVHEDRVFETFFELTSERLRYIYDRLSRLKQIEEIDLHAICLELKDAGVSVNRQEVNSLKELLHSADVDHDGEISFAEFEVLIQSLKLALLLKNLSRRQKELSFQQHVSKTDVIECFNYHVGKYKLQRVLCGFSPSYLFRVNDTNVRLSDFMYKPRGKEFSNRWINLSLANEVGLKALAIKYRVHPLALEDILLNETGARAKVENFMNHMLVCLPVFHLTVFTTSNQEESGGIGGRKYSSVMRRDSYYGSLDEQRRRARLYSQGAQGTTVTYEEKFSPTKKTRKSMFQRFFRRASSELSMDPYERLEDDPDIEVDEAGMMQNSSEDRHFDTKRVPRVTKNNAFVIVVKSNHLHVARRLNLAAENSTTKKLNTVISMYPPKIPGIFESIAKEIKLPYSKLKSSSSIYLTYALVDAIVDSYFPVVQHYNQYTEALMAELRASDHTHDSKEFGTIYQDLTRELSKLRRWLLPVAKVFDLLIESSRQNLSKSKNLEEMSSDKEQEYVYFRDVKDSLEQLIDEVNEVIESSKQLHYESHQGDERKMNIVMTRLTIVATIFLPAQFLTGVFGMNFEFMPELKWKWGYEMFWLICFLSWVGLFYMLRYKY
eukprot:snap_masked-scaffold_11-processed-gene-10.32-mRNA-1 protein AED:1.00 eAED:1.00 QI:0/0/0/0/1/1/2/0/666